MIYSNNSKKNNENNYPHPILAATTVPLLHPPISCRLPVHQAVLSVV